MEQITIRVLLNSSILPVNLHTEKLLSIKKKDVIYYTFNFLEFYSSFHSREMTFLQYLWLFCCIFHRPIHGTWLRRALLKTLTSVCFMLCFVLRTFKFQTFSKQPHNAVTPPFQSRLWNLFSFQTKACTSSHCSEKHIVLSVKISENLS